MNSFFPRQLQPHVRRLPGLANLVLVVLLGLALARLFWTLWPVDTAPVGAGVGPGFEAPAEDKVNVDQIASAYLFGEQSATPQPQNQIINAPETQLNLVLTGIVASNDEHGSRALIKTAANEQKPYEVGDDIANGVKLHAIYSNRVILDRNGRFETLTLEQEKAGDNAISRSSPPTGVTPELARSLGQAREQILQDPSRAAQYLRIQPERRNGGLVGYRIYPGSNRALFQKAGLRPGELVTAINGQSLDNPSESLKLLGNLSDASSVTVTLERGGQSRTMTVSFQ